MCGRFVQVSTSARLLEHFDVDELVADADWRPSYNIAPRAQVLAVIERDGDRRMEAMRWGLIPSWATDVSIGDSLINARAETILEKPAFRVAFQQRRCIIPADGFYEWRPAPGPKQQPMFIQSPRGLPLAFAGLWEAWRDHTDPAAPWIRSCVVMTTAANATMRDVHDRMPAILGASDWARWLHCDLNLDDPQTRLELLRPAPDDSLEMWPVSTRVNSARHDDATLIVREDPLTLFP